jgi:hypothetical protein
VLAVEAFNSGGARRLMMLSLSRVGYDSPSVASVSPYRGTDRGRNPRELRHFGASSHSPLDALADRSTLAPSMLKALSVW